MTHCIYLLVISTFLRLKNYGVIDNYLMDLKMFGPSKPIKC